MYSLCGHNTLWERKVFESYFTSRIFAFYTVIADGHSTHTFPGYVRGINITEAHNFPVAMKLSKSLTMS